jgi:hypothetical protein
MPFEEKMLLVLRNNTKHINIFCEQNVEPLINKAGGTHHYN